MCDYPDFPLALLRKGMFAPLPSFILPKVLGTGHGVISLVPSSLRASVAVPCCSAPLWGIWALVLLPLPMTAPFLANCY